MGTGRGLFPVFMVFDPARGSKTSWVVRSGPARRAFASGPEIGPP
ncbi:MAG: hypothetical protein QOC59_1525, partial [Microbacteriaceae bacterium]|nr:hypothetical protein [Microbacteriaceae bacterium]